MGDVELPLFTKKTSTTETTTTTVTALVTTGANVTVSKKEGAYEMSFCYRIRRIVSLRSVLAFTRVGIGPVD